jgi:DNA-3-methyladenine glycosylase
LSAAPLEAGFFRRPTLAIARDLLGKVLLHETPEGRVAGRIVEVEAYLGVRDRAAHTYGGRRTPRNASMWGPGGRVYVYFTYGMHHCVNVVTREEGRPEAVLLRALAPLEGEDGMRARRGVGAEVPTWRLARGPGNLCRAMRIDRALDGADLASSALRLLAAPRVPAALVARGPRIGVAYAGPDALRPYRFWIRDEPAVSASRAAPVASPRPEDKISRSLRRS